MHTNSKPRLGFVFIATSLTLTMFSVVNMSPRKANASSLQSASTSALVTPNQVSKGLSVTNPQNNSSKQSVDATVPNTQSDPNAKITQTSNGYTMKNDKFEVQIGTSGEIDGLYIANDAFKTNYVINPNDNPKQNNAAHEWMGELMFRTKVGDASSSMPWDKEYTSQTPATVRKISLKNNSVQVVYNPVSNKNGKNDGIKRLEVVETYTLNKSGQLNWNINVKNNTDSKLTIGDFGLPMPFREYWHYSPTAGKNQLDMAYENSVVFHSFVGQDSSYIYATRPSGIGNFLTFTPDASTNAKLEYQDHWEDDGTHSAAEKAWSMPKFGADVAGTTGWDNGLNVFYVNSAAVAPSGNRGYLPSTDTVLNSGESKNFAFNFSTADISNANGNTSASSTNQANGDMTDTKYEEQLKSILYKENLVDAVSIPSMVLTKDASGVAKGEMYLHTKVPRDQISLSFQNQHDDEVAKQNNPKEDKIDAAGVSNELGKATYKKTVQKNGQNYYIYDLQFSSSGRNNIVVNYQLDGQQKKTTLQYDVLDNPAKSLEKHAQFMLKTQIQNPGKFNDQIFDDWSMDNQKNVGNFTTPYGGWGDDWGLTHGLFLASMNTKIPNKSQVQALDNYLYTGIWNNLMRKHHDDYGVPDWLRPTEDRYSYAWRAYSYVHVYNTFFEMYKIAKANPDLIKYNVQEYPPYKSDLEKYKNDPADVYLTMAYNILKACYTNSGVRYKDDGLMGESTTPEIIAALKAEKMTDQATNVEKWMKAKYDTYTGQKYPFGSEMNYDNTGEESVYMLGNMFGDKRLMSMADMKTRADRGVQPLWYQYGVPVTIDGENWWQFQYTTSLADVGMNNWLVSQDNGLTEDQKGLAERANYAAKLGNLTQINTGQIDSQEANNGAVSWTYQAELGNDAQPNENSIAKTGAGNLHNGWRQTSGEGDLALFGALQVLSADIADDPIFGLVGYGADVTDTGISYDIIPEDGLNQRLNLVNKQIAYEFTGDRYTKAHISKDNATTIFNVENVDKKAHDLQLAITNPHPDSAKYDVLWNDKKLSSIKEDQSTTRISIPIDAKDGTLKIVKQGTVTSENSKPGNSKNSNSDVNNNGADKTSNSSSSLSNQSSTPTLNNSSNSSNSPLPSNTTSESTSNKSKTPTELVTRNHMVYSTKKIYLYKHADFKKSERIKKYLQSKRVNRPQFVVKGYVKDHNGNLRYQVQEYNSKAKKYVQGTKGYITANPDYVVNLYYQGVPRTKRIVVINTNGVNSYRNVVLTSKVKHYKKGTILDVKQITKYQYTTRYKLTNGTYVTANKKFVIDK